ncbi:MAG: hypothetical protein IKH15_06685 [Bacteroidales bacterium]|nr:hypothetical protein [Bacteroidales bacterium]MBR7051615.1 hypothetical protein [Bacteroidaceae bacterium]
MKILTSKKVEQLFDDIIKLDLCGSEMFLAATAGDTGRCIRMLEKIVESSMNAAYILKGMEGCFILQEVHSKMAEQREKNEEEPKTHRDPTRPRHDPDGKTYCKGPMG